jgi:hypothetical protein
MLASGALLATLRWIRQAACVVTPDEPSTGRRGRPDAVHVLDQRDPCVLDDIVDVGADIAVGDAAQHGCAAVDDPGDG